MVQLSFRVIPKYEKFTIYDHLLICREVRKEFAVCPVEDAIEGGFEFVNEFHVRTNGARQFSRRDNLGLNLLCETDRNLYKGKYKSMWCLGKGKLGGDIYSNFPHEKFYKVRDIFESLGHLVVCNGDFMTRPGKSYVVSRGKHNVMSLKKIEEARLLWKDTERQEILLKKVPYDVMLQIFQHLKRAESEGSYKKNKRKEF
jgi:hypothetical protein